MDHLAPDIIRLTAPNPSPMTYTGTQTYVVGTDEVYVIDPGPRNDAHLDAIMSAAGGRSIAGVIVTHSHLDHSPLAHPLAKRADCPVYAFGDSESGKSEIMQHLAAKGFAGGGEGVDRDFTPDFTLSDGEQIGPFEVIHTPGHMGNHICLRYGDIIFTGDHIMGWATSLVSPPDGDLTDFMLSCRKLQQIEALRYLPAHGDPIDTPKERLEWLITHRLEREAQILAALENGLTTVQDITAHIYTDIVPALIPAAERNVFAHLIDLKQQNRVDVAGALSFAAKFSPT